MGLLELGSISQYWVLLAYEQNKWLPVGTF